MKIFNKSTKVAVLGSSSSLGDLNSGSVVFVIAKWLEAKLFENKQVI